MKNIASILLAAVGLNLVSAVAIAGPAVTHVPEPMSMSILGGGVLVIAAVKRLRRK